MLLLNTLLFLNLSADYQFPGNINKVITQCSGIFAEYTCQKNFNHFSDKDTGISFNYHKNWFVQPIYKSTGYTQVAITEADLSLVTIEKVTISSEHDIQIFNGFIEKIKQSNAKYTLETFTSKGLNYIRMEVYAFGDKPSNGYRVHLFAKTNKAWLHVTAQKFYKYTYDLPIEELINSLRW